jgi:hypothetical protein
LEAKGYPQLCNNYGIAFGRGNNTTNTRDAGVGHLFTSTNPFGPEDEIFYGSIAFFLANAETIAHAVPENNNQATIAYYSFFGITFRKIFGIPIYPVVTLRIRRFDYRGQYPYDDAPGSFELTQKIFADNMTGWANGLSQDATTNDHDGHNFVSVASALDLQNQNYGLSNHWQSDNMFFNIDGHIQNTNAVNGNTLDNTNLSPFQAVITGTSNNAVTNAYYFYHNSDISHEHSLFILRRILGANPSFDCQTEAFCNLNPTINGLNYLCTTGNYYISNLPNGVGINWSSMFGNFVVIAGQGTPNVTISKINNGNDTLVLTLTNSCSTSKEIHLGIYVGTIDAPGITADNCLRKHFTHSYSATSTPTGGTLIWGYYEGYSGGSFNSVNTNGSTAIFRIPNYEQYNRVYLAVENNCGVGTPSIVIFEYSDYCEGQDEDNDAKIPTDGKVLETTPVFNSLRVYPNPSDNYLIVELPNKYLGGTLKLMTLNGQLIKKDRISNNRLIFNNINQTAGVYFIEVVTKDGITERRKIIIAH